MAGCSLRGFARMARTAVGHTAPRTGRPADFRSRRLTVWALRVERLNAAPRALRRDYVDRRTAAASAMSTPPASTSEPIPGRVVALPCTCGPTSMAAVRMGNRASNVNAAPSGTTIASTSAARRIVRIRRRMSLIPCAQGTCDAASRVSQPDAYHTDVSRPRFDGSSSRVPRLKRPNASRLRAQRQHSTVQREKVFPFFGQRPLCRPDVARFT